MAVPVINTSITGLAGGRVVPVKSLAVVAVGDWLEFQLRGAEDGRGGPLLNTIAIEREAIPHFLESLIEEARLVEEFRADDDAW